MERRYKLQSSYLKLLVGLGIALCTYFYTAPDIGTLVLLYTPQTSAVMQGGERYASSRLATSTPEPSPVQVQVQVQVHVVGESSSRKQTVAEKNQMYGESSSSSSVDTKDKPNSSTDQQEKEHTEIPPLLEDKDDEPSQTKGTSAYRIIGHEKMASPRTSRRNLRWRMIRILIQLLLLLLLWFTP
jgi:hypothetical protein